MMRRLLFTLVLTLAAVSAAAQGVYVASDKSCYVAGDVIGCSAFCKPGSPVVYVELVSTEGSAARTRIALEKGRGAGTLEIPFDTPTGNYRLVAYVPGSEPDPSAGPVISVFNTLGTDRVKDGVEVVERSSAGIVASQSGYGIAADIQGDSIVVHNTSGSLASVCISLYREDSLQGAGRASIASFKALDSGAGGFGETISGRVLGADAACATRVLLAVPGSKTDCYQADVAPDGSFQIPTENIFGNVDLVCIPVGADKGKDCYVTLDSPFRCPPAEGLPKLELFRAMESDLLRRTAAMRLRASEDTLSVSLPVHQEHFFMNHECISYVLDDYTRFPTMEEVLVEIVPQVKMRRRAGAVRIYVLLETSVKEATPVWGEAAVMIDGVPVPDCSLIESYDPALVKVLEVYPYKYSMGGKEFDGVVNLRTFKGNMPGLLFDDCVRIYGFRGCSYPVALRGPETILWSPLENIAGGGSKSLDCAGAEKGAYYTLSVEGLTDDGRAVYFRKTFRR